METEVIVVRPANDSDIDIDPTVMIGGTVVKGDTVNVYKVSVDTQPVRVSVSGVNSQASISVYAIGNDTKLTGIGSVSGSLTLDNRNSASITVVVTYGDLNNKKTYTVNFVTSNGNTEQPDEPSNPDAPEGGDNGEVTE